MQTKQTVSLLPRDAARLIFHTETPTLDQVATVVQQFERGELVGRRHAKHRWTTTAPLVADFMARQAVQQAGRRSTTVGFDASSAAALQLSRVYQDILRDYFLAVVQRRKFRHRSKWFDRAATLGQVFSLAGALAILTAVGRLGFSPEPPERHAVTRWLQENVARYEVKKWHPAQVSEDDRFAVRVEYEYYSAGGKAISTDRTFLVEDGRVSKVQDDH